MFELITEFGLIGIERDTETMSTIFRVLADYYHENGDG